MPWTGITRPVDSQLISSYMFYDILTDLASEKQNTLLERCIVQNYIKKKKAPFLNAVFHVSHHPGSWGLVYPLE